MRVVVLFVAGLLLASLAGSGCAVDPDSCVRERVRTSASSSSCSVVWTCPDDKEPVVLCLIDAQGTTTCSCSYKGEETPPVETALEACTATDVAGYSLLAYELTTFAIDNDCFPGLPIDPLEDPRQ